MEETCFTDSYWEKIEARLKLLLMSFFPIWWGEFSFFFTRLIVSTYSLFLDAWQAGTGLELQVQHKKEHLHLCLDGGKKKKAGIKIRKPKQNGMACVLCVWYRTTVPLWCRWLSTQEHPKWLTILCLCIHKQISSTPSAAHYHSAHFISSLSTERWLLWRNVLPYSMLYSICVSLCAWVCAHILKGAIFWSLMGCVENSFPSLKYDSGRQTVLANGRWEIEMIHEKEKAGHSGVLMSAFNIHQTKKKLWEMIQKTKLRRLMCLTGNLSRAENSSAKCGTALKRLWRMHLWVCLCVLQVLVLALELLCELLSRWLCSMLQNLCVSIFSLTTN